MKRMLGDKKIILFVFFLSTLCLLLQTNKVSAETYTVYKESELIDYLKLSSEDTIILGGPITLNSRVNVLANKVLDLNNQILTAAEANFDKSGGINLANNTNLKSFTIKNGVINGGPTNGLSGYSSKAGFIYADDKNYNLTVNVQNITHTGAGFFKGRSADILFKGKIILDNKTFNVRALNMTMYGNPNDVQDVENTDFTGNVTAGGSADANATGTSGVNLTFDGYNENSYKSVGKKTKNLNILKNAKVKVVNTNKSSILEFSNNVGNFAQINIDGSFDADSQGSSLRTTAAYYGGVVGTDSNQSEINVNPGSVFRVVTSNSDNSKGVLYSYSLDLNVNNPEIFDIRNLGKEIFFFGWPERNRNNMRLYNTNVGVWSKDAKGVGNPLYLWQDVGNIIIGNFYYGDGVSQMLKNTTSSDTSIPAKFNINTFSRISNDVTLPLIVTDVKRIANNATSLAATTDYTMPDGSLVGKVAPNALITMTVDGVAKATTTTDSSGNWVFNNLDLSSIKGGKNLVLTIYDTDKRYAKENLIIPVDDKIPPTGNFKLVKTLQKQYTFIDSPKNAVTNVADETDGANITTTFVDTVDKLKEGANTLGVKKLSVSLRDKANNERIIDSKLLVTDNLNATGLVIGNDFNISYDKWMEMSDKQRRQEIITNGNVQAWSVTNSDVIDVTADASKLSITYSAKDWKPLDVVEIVMKVGNYTKTIKATLDIDEVPTVINYLDDKGESIAKGTTQKMIPQRQYTIKALKIPGYQIVGVKEDGVEKTLTSDQSIIITMGAVEKDISFIYQSIHFTATLKSSLNKAAQGDNLNYTLDILSGMHYEEGQTIQNFKNFKASILIDGTNLENIHEITVLNNQGDAIGSGSYNSSTHQISVTLNSNVKDTTNVFVSFKSTIKESAKTGDAIKVSATVSAIYDANGDKVIKKNSQEITTNIEGKLKFISKIKTVDFGEVEYLAKNERVDDKKVEGSMIVSDRRPDTSSGWYVTAKVETKMHMEDDVLGDIPLAGRLTYVYNGKDVPLSENSQIIYRVDQEKVENVNITDTWAKGKDGLKLDFNSTDSPKSGSYTGVIKWQIMEGQP